VVVGDGCGLMAMLDEEAELGVPVIRVMHCRSVGTGYRRCALEDGLQTTLTRKCGADAGPTMGDIMIDSE
jgi:hypothetical protein